MATQLDRLNKVGHEGFALIEEWYGRSGRSGTGRPVNCGPQVSTVRLPVAGSNEIAQRDGAITSDQAAEYYGGFVIVDHGRRKTFRRAAC